MPPPARALRACLPILRPRHVATSWDDCVPYAASAPGRTDDRSVADSSRRRRPSPEGLVTKLLGRRRRVGRELGDGDAVGRGHGGAGSVARTRIVNRIEAAVGCALVPDAVLLVSDLAADRYPTRCVWTGEPTSGAAHVWALASRHADRVIALFGGVGVLLWRALGRKAMRVPV